MEKSLSLEIIHLSLFVFPCGNEHIRDVDRLLGSFPKMGKSINIQISSMF